jgi:hypothetical protein
LTRKVKAMENESFDREAFMKELVEPVPVPKKRRKFRKYAKPVCSPETKARLYELQEGRCAVCGEEFEAEDLFIDHSYRTGKTRGLLCRLHNTALGMMKDSHQLLAAAIRYLKHPPMEQLEKEATA